MRVRGMGWLRGVIVPLAVATVSVSCASAGPGGGASVSGPRQVLPLWEISDGEHTVHLLGSIHLLRKDAYPLDPAIYEAFDSAEVVVFEVDLDEAATAAGAMMSRGMLPPDRTLADLAPPDLVAEVERSVAGLPIPFDAVKRMEPWLAAVVLSATVLQQAGFDATSGIDLHFHGRARDAGKPVVGLETMGDQIDVMDGLSESAQVAFLRSTLAELDSAASQLDEATAAWRRGDVDALAAMNTRALRDQPELTDRMLHRRNQRWVPQIESLLRAGEAAFVVVGVGHLVGEGSVVELLRERGLRVTRVAATASAAAGA